MKAVKLTPKKVASAIGVSESSMKRWCDRGLIDFRTTAGGHRRLSQASVIGFLRKGKHALVKSELIGLPTGIRPSERDAQAGRQDFMAAIGDGPEAEARKILIELFIGGQSLADLSDRVIAPTFSDIGIQWECGDLEVYRERRACEITLRILTELRQLLPVADASAPLALGGSPGRDGYSLPTMIVEMVFREAGWRAQSLGSQLPFSTLAAAARDQNPRLFWLSVSHIENEMEFLQSFEQFRTALPHGTFLAVGGHALKEPIRQRMQFSAFGDNMKQLEALAKTLKSTAIASNGNGNGVVSNY